MMQIFDRDQIILDEFAADPKEYLERDGNLAIDLKRMYHQRTQEIERRKNMGVNNIDNMTDSKLKERGVSKREFELIKKFLAIDKEMFAAKEHPDQSPFTLTVDLSKYENVKIPQECKDILYRPKKMQLLYERYW